MSIMLTWQLVLILIGREKSEKNGNLTYDVCQELFSLEIKLTFFSPTLKSLSVLSKILSICQNLVEKRNDQLDFSSAQGS